MILYRLTQTMIGDDRARRGARMMRRTFAPPSRSLSPADTIGQKIDIMGGYFDSEGANNFSLHAAVMLHFDGRMFLQK